MADVHPDARRRVHALLEEIARVYPRGLLRWARARREDLAWAIEDAERAIELAAERWQPDDTRDLDVAIEVMRKAYKDAIEAYRTKKEVARG